jgi:hypothetical protein
VGAEQLAIAVFQLLMTKGVLLALEALVEQDMAVALILL